MTDPLSVTAGIAGLVSLGIQVTESLVKFYTSYKGQDADVTRTTENLESLLGTFQFLSSALQNRTFRPDEQDLIRNIESYTYQCDDLIQELKEECKKFDKTSVGGIKGTIKVVGRRATYPFRQSTLQKLDEDISEIRENLSLALEVLQLRDHRIIQDDIIEVKSLVEAVRAAQISATIRDWLKAPDATVNHEAACAKRHPGTGVWFVKGSIFPTWLIQARSFLWLNGFAGCGKSVLCSTAIQYAFRHKRSGRGVGIAFFYFTFNDESKQNDSAMLRALLLQLSGQLSDNHTDLTSLHNLYRTGIPPAAILIEYLRNLIRRFHQVYILLDALDESPRYGRRDRVLNAIETMRKWRLPGLHLLVTSRDESDIRESLNPTGDTEVIMKNAEINRDVSNFISGQLNTDWKLQKWRAYHDRIQQVLAERAQGVFRWVECQFESLRRCPRSESHLDRCLQSLPRSLDETYERILGNIDEGSVEEARRILTLLCFSTRPLTVHELIDGIAVDLHKPACLNLRRRLQDVDDLREICPGLIDVGVQENNETRFRVYGSDDVNGVTPTLRIAHFSVQEYLESDRIKLHQFALESASAHAEIAQICLVYLLEPGLSSGMLDQTTIEKFPLVLFAADFWHDHYKNAAGMTPGLDDLILKIFQQRQGSFYTWVTLHNVDVSRVRLPFPPSSRPVASPIYYASLLGLDEVLHGLIDICQDNKERQDLINAQGGVCGNALQAASVEGHDKVVKILIDAGADVNAEGGEDGNALQAALDKGHEKVVKMLLEAGAEVNAQGGRALEAASEKGNDRVVQMLIEVGADVNALYRNALCAASKGGYDKVVQILLEAGAEINAQVGYYGNALQAASEGGHEKVVQILLEAGAEVNTQGEYYGNALQAAAAGGHEKVVQVLLEAGAEVNAQGGYYGNALQAASRGGHEKVVKILLEAAAEVNAQGGYYGNALQVAAAGGFEKVVQILLKAGAEINAQNGFYGNALYAASYTGHDKVVQILLEAGAEVNAQGTEHGNALRAASLGGHEKVVKILLEAGSEINAQNGFHGNALYVASHIGHGKAVQILLEAGAEVNAQGGLHGNALQAASEGGHEKVVQILLEAGAEVNTQDGYYGNALQAASQGYHEKTVKILLEAGAEVNAQGGFHGNALQAASCLPGGGIVKLLIDAGADVNAQGALDGNALQAAAAGGHEKVVQILLEAGAEVNAQGTEHGNALRAASLGGHEKVVKILLEAGSEINAQNGFHGNALYVASHIGHGKAVQILLEAGAEVNAQGGLHGNALQAASEGGHEKVVQILLEAGAEVNAQGGLDGDALQAAAAGGHEKVVQILLEAGAEVNTQGGYYGNAVQAAAAECHEKIMQILLEAGAEMNAQGGYDGSEKSA